MDGELGLGHARQLAEGEHRLDHGLLHALGESDLDGLLLGHERVQAGVAHQGQLAVGRIDHGVVVIAERVLGHVGLGLGVQLLAVHGCHFYVQGHPVGRGAAVREAVADAADHLGVDHRQGDELGGVRLHPVADRGDVQVDPLLQPLAGLGLVLVIGREPVAALVAHVTVLAGLGAAHGHVEVLVAVKGGGAPHGLVVVLHVRALVTLGAEHRVAHHLAGLCGVEGGVAVRAGVFGAVDDSGLGGAVPELAQDGVAAVADQAGDLQFVEHLLVTVDNRLGDLHGHGLGGIHHLRQMALHAGFEEFPHAGRDLVRLLQLRVAGVDVALEGGERPADGAEHRLGVQRLLPVRVDFRVALLAPGRIEPGHQFVQGLRLLGLCCAGLGQQQNGNQHPQQFHTLLLCQECPTCDKPGHDAIGKGNRRTGALACLCSGLFRVRMRPSMCRSVRRVTGYRQTGCIILQSSRGAVNCRPGRSPRRRLSQNRFGQGTTRSAARRDGFSATAGALP